MDVTWNVRHSGSITWCVIYNMVMVLGLSTGCSQGRRLHEHEDNQAWRALECSATMDKPLGLNVL